MTDDKRVARLRSAESAVADAGVDAARVLAAFNETFEALPAPLAVPDDPRAREVVVTELASARAELLGASGALGAILTRERELFELLEPLGLHPDPTAFAAHRIEFAALSSEESRQRDRIAVLEAVVRDLEDALRKVGPPTRNSFVEGGHGTT